MTAKAVGNLQVPKNELGNVDLLNAQAQFRNQTVGLGGNAAFVTEGSVNTPVVGVAYHCS
jgi:hypothetical protein